MGGGVCHIVHLTLQPRVWLAQKDAYRACKLVLITVISLNDSWPFPWMFDSESLGGNSQIVFTSGDVFWLHNFLCVSRV